VPDRIGAERPAWFLAAAPAATFLVGVLIGGLVFGVAIKNDGSGDASSIRSTTPPTVTGPTSSDVTVTVPGACEDAAAVVQQSLDLLRQAATAVRDFNPSEVVDVLDQLEEADAELRELSTQCSAVDVQSDN